MKYLSKFFIIILFVSFTSELIAEEKIVFIDMNKIIFFSTAGQNADKKLKKYRKEQISKMSETEKKLKEEETKIISQKNILSKEEYAEKIKILRQKANDYRINRKNILDELTKKRFSLTKNMIDKIQPIIADYSTSKNISLVIQKKNLVLGKTELDITDEILILVNKKITKITLN